MDGLCTESALDTGKIEIVIDLAVSIFCTSIGKGLSIIPNSTGRKTIYVGRLEGTGQ